MSVETYQLDIWQGDWGLPSVDADCLRILTYAKLLEVPIITKASNNPFKSPNGKLPILKCNNSHKVICEVDQIVDFLESKSYKLDKQLSNKELSENLAYAALLETTMRPTIKYIWWLDQTNLNDVIRPWFAKAIPFPLNFYYPGKFEKEAKLMINALFTENENQVNETAVYGEAIKCITSLSTRLGDSNYFYGSTPTSLDVLVFSYLAPILNIPLPSCSLRNHLIQCENLVKLIARIMTKYFCGDYQENCPPPKKEKEEEIFDAYFPNKRRDQILAGLFATFAMTTYAFSTGIVQVLDEDEEPEESVSYFDEVDEG